MIISSDLTARTYEALKETGLAARISDIGVPLLSENVVQLMVSGSGKWQSPS